jgi:hypothetical protein
MNNEYCSYRMNIEIFKLQLSLIFVVAVLEKKRRRGKLLSLSCKKKR